MCWNCGCMMPDNDMGDRNNITTAMLRKAAKAGGNKTLKDLMQNVTRTYEEMVKGTPEDTKPVS